MKIKDLPRPPDSHYDPRRKKRLDSFLGYLPKDARVLDVGSGTQKIRPEIITIDILPLENVNCVADAHTLPFKSDSFDAVLSFALLEHVTNPFKVISEIERIVKPNGLIFIGAPFIQGYHPETGTEADYWRFTLSGLELLCSRFEKIESGVAGGGASALTWVIREFVTSPFYGRAFLGKLSRFIIGWLACPLKYLDFFFSKTKGAKIIASSVYFIGRKRSV